MSSKTIQFFNSLLKAAVQHGVSDVHLRPGKKPYFRQKNGLMPIEAPVITVEQMKEICGFIIKDQELVNNLDTIREHDGSYQLGQICRVRYNLMRYQGEIGLVFRIIVLTVPTVDDLKLPPVIKDIANSRRGLILVTGATGSGKSSTMAAMVEHINTTRADHILSIEDPVEFLYQSKKSLVTQREIGKDSDSFLNALRGALRQDPDVILIGEMRDAETVQIAVKAAETGHVVFATVHTTNALTTIGRIVSMFPPEEQQEVKRRLADNLQATVSQRLLPKKGQPGRVCVQEIMVTSPGVKECIVGKEPLENIYVFMENGYKEGESQSFDQVLVDLVKSDTITMETGLDAASSPNNFVRSLQFGDEADSSANEGKDKVGKQNDSGLELDIIEEPEPPVEEEVPEEVPEEIDMMDLAKIKREAERIKESQKEISTPPVIENKTAFKKKSVG